MFAPGFAFYHNIVDIDFNGPTDQGFEDLCHQPLLGGSNVFEPKWHDLVAIQSVWCHEDDLLLIWLEHRNLMVPGESVYEREHPVPDSEVNYLIYSRQWEVVF